MSCQKALILFWLACQFHSYIPIRFILQPGEFVFIGKARMHAFRKETGMELLPNDCHYHLQRNLLKGEYTDSWDLVKYECMSYTFDCMYMGISVWVNFLMLLHQFTYLPTPVSNEGYNVLLLCSLTSNQIADNAFLSLYMAGNKQNIKELSETLAFPRLSILLTAEQHCA